MEESTDESLETEENIRMVCLFDHEEVGSSSFHGAASQFVETVLKRICSEGPVKKKKKNFFFLSFLFLLFFYKNLYLFHKFF